MNIQCVLLAVLFSNTLHAQLKFASATANAHSIALLPAQGNVPGVGFLTTYFTTFDGTANFPLVTSNGIVSSELRPRAGQPGVYETDYVMIDAFARVAEYGSLTINLPTSDLDANGLPDVVQKKFASTATFTGAGRIDWPSVTTFSLSGEMYRAANSNAGNIVVDSRSSAGTVRFTGGMRLASIQGQIEYTRGVQNTVRLNYQMTDPAGTTHTLTGSTSFTVTDQNHVAFPNFVLTSSTGTTYSVRATTLVRSGKRYVGTVRMTDGAPVTPWADYINWTTEIVDNNDTDRDTIPDFSDPSLSPEFVKPTLAITSPANNARLSNAVVVVRGTAKDNRGIRQVLCRLNGGAFEPATGTTTWSRTLNLILGTNVIVAKAIDVWGNESAPVTLKVVHAPTSRLTITTSGNGTVSPNLNGRWLEVGARYSCTAVPGPGFVFSSWTGGVVAETATIGFIMTSNMSFQANFIPSPFLAVTGLYNGLFFESSAVLHESSGFVQMNVGEKGTFSGFILSAGQSNVLNGRFALNGSAAVSVTRPTKRTLNLSLMIDLPTRSGEIVGTVSDGIWSAGLVADRLTFHTVTNPAPQQGNFNVAFLGECGNLSSPAGDGYVLVRILPGGRVLVNGSMADGTAVAHSALLSKDGAWPLYFSLYQGRGSALAWVNCLPSREIPEGEISWIRPTMSAPRYANGFTNNLVLAGSSYIRRTAGSPLNLTNAQIVFCGGGLLSPITNFVTFVPPNRFRNLGTSPLQFLINTTNGSFNGYFVEPATRKTNTFKGALLQKYNSGAGFFLGPATSGRVRLEALPSAE